MLQNRKIENVDKSFLSFWRDQSSYVKFHSDSNKTFSEMTLTRCRISGLTTYLWRFGDVFSNKWLSFSWAPTVLIYISTWFVYMKLSSYWSMFGDFTYREQIVCISHYWGLTVFPRKQVLYYKWSFPIHLNSKLHLGIQNIPIFRIYVCKL